VVIYMMTRKDFEKFAEAFGKMRPARIPGADRGAKMTVDVFMDVCEEINPRFDRERFWERVMHHYRNKEEE